MNYRQIITFVSIIKKKSLHILKKTKLEISIKKNSSHISKYSLHDIGP